MPETMAVLGLGAAFALPEIAARYGFDGEDMQAELLPASLRRRTSTATKLAFAAAERACRRAGVDPASLPVIFTSSLGEIAVTDTLCADIAARRYPLSPTRFHNSVHNTAAGYWSIAVGNRHPAMAMAAYQDSFALALLESWSQLNTGGDRVLLVHFEETPPPLMLPDNDWPGCAAALVLANASPAPMARLTRPCLEGDDAGADGYTAHSPILPSLSLLGAVQNRSSGRMAVSPADGGAWIVEVLN